MLSDVDLPKLRVSVTKTHRKRFKAPTRRVLLTGGPLDSMTAVVEQRDAETFYIRWCVVTDRGPTHAMYRLEQPGRFTFAELVESFGRSKR